MTIFLCPSVNTISLVLENPLSLIIESSFYNFFYTILIPAQVKGFRSYVDMYLKDKVDETGNPLKIIHEQVNHRWEVCLTMSEKGFQQISFVNSIATSKVTLFLNC